jgi:hypothetical protein
MEQYTVIRGNKTLAYRGMKDGLFVICTKEPEFLDDVKNPLLTDEKAAGRLAAKYGGKVKKV